MIRKTTLPAHAMLSRYADGTASYTDCFAYDYAGPVDLENFLNAFFNSWVFRLERFILKAAARVTISDEDTANFAAARSDRMGLWTAQDRDESQVLTIVGQGPIHSWWMVEPKGERTRLYFGSAIRPMTAKDGSQRMNPAAKYGGLPHRIYARILLAVAARKLRAAKDPSRRPA